jgi:hypothetical protein
MASVGLAALYSLSLLMLICSYSANDRGSVSRTSRFLPDIKTHPLLSSPAGCPFVLGLKGGDGLPEFSRTSKMGAITNNAALESSKKQTGEGQERRSRRPDATTKETTFESMKRATSKVIKRTTLTKGRATQRKQTESASEGTSMKEDVTMKEPIAAVDVTFPARKARVTSRSEPLLMHWFGRPNRSIPQKHCSKLNLIHV